MKVSIEEVKTILQKYKPLLKEKYGVKKLGVFGSVARGDNKDKSDIDVLVEFSKDSNIGMFEYVDLQDYLKKILKRKVDLTTKQGLKKAIKKSVLEETLYV
jgi:uncharacterized protein